MCVATFDLREGNPPVSLQWKRVCVCVCVTFAFQPCVVVGLLVLVLGGARGRSGVGAPPLPSLPGASRCLRQGIRSGPALPVPLGCSCLQRGLSSEEGAAEGGWRAGGIVELFVGGFYGLSGQ